MAVNIRPSLQSPLPPCQDQDHVPYFYFLHTNGSYLSTHPAGEMFCKSRGNELVVYKNDLDQDVADKVKYKQELHQPSAYLKSRREEGCSVALAANIITF